MAALQCAQSSVSLFTARASISHSPSSRSPVTSAHIHRQNALHSGQFLHGTVDLKAAIPCSPAFVRRRRGIEASGLSVSFGEAGEGELEKFSVGSKVRVTADLVVYHVPKNADGLNLKGMEGELKEKVQTHKGKPISATHPLKIAFELPGDGAKSTKFFAHLKTDEAEPV